LVLAPLIQAIFWKIAMHRALGGEVDGDAVVEDFHAPFAGPAGPWQFMRVMRWGGADRASGRGTGFPAAVTHADSYISRIKGRRDP